MTTGRDFQTDQEVRWCPGCGDYAILATLQRLVPTLGVPREKMVFVSGIGCSSRLPSYMNTYGFHTIHGRAPAVATGVKLANPELTVWVVTGDGDGLSIGGNHLMHALRRNIEIKILLFNNRIFGLTKGQYSPTSELGKRTKSTPQGSVEHPFQPLSVALGAEATFVARSVDFEAKHLESVLRRAAEHRGAAFVEIVQNCNVFNDGAFDAFTAKDAKTERQLGLEHGKPLLFGAERKKGIRVRDLTPEVVEVGKDGITEADVLVHDETQASGALAYLLSRLELPRFPVPLGVLRAVERPTHDAMTHAQMAGVQAKRGRGDLMKLLRSGETWTVS